MTPPPQELPKYTDDLSEGHSDDCLDLKVEHYSDLHTDIKNTIALVKETTLTLIDKDIIFADEIDRAFGWLDQSLRRINYRSLLDDLSNIQRILRMSELDEEERTTLWTPIAECYARVQGALKERILPLKERQLLRVGETTMIPVRISRIGLERIGSHLTLASKLPKFGYAIERTAGSSGRLYQEGLNYVEFEDRYVSALPASVTDRLPDGTMELPVKITYAAPDMVTCGEIDMEEFLKSHQ